VLLKDILKVLQRSPADGSDGRSACSARHRRGAGNEADGPPWRPSVHDHSDSGI